MIDLYTWTTPNGRKISIALEEMGLPYTVHAVDIGKDEQFKPEFLKISPNNRIPAIVDRDNGLSLMESGAILLYLGDKTGKLLPKSGDKRWKTLEWLNWQMGGPGPMLGQVHHFVKYNAGKAPYAEERYLKEAHRLYGVLNKQLDGREYVADDYSIADIAIWPWISPLRVADHRPEAVSERAALVSGDRQQARDAEGLQGAQGRRRGADPEVIPVPKLCEKEHAGSPRVLEALLRVPGPRPQRKANDAKSHQDRPRRQVRRGDSGRVDRRFQADGRPICRSWTPPSSMPFARRCAPAMSLPPPSTAWCSSSCRCRRRLRRPS